MEKLQYQITEYLQTKETAVLAYTQDGEPFCDCSVCLKDYGITLPENQIAVPSYKLYGYERSIMDDISVFDIKTISIGPFSSIVNIVELKPEVLAFKGREDYYIP